MFLSIRIYQPCQGHNILINIKVSSFCLVQKQSGFSFHFTFYPTDSFVYCSNCFITTLLWAIKSWEQFKCNCFILPGRLQFPFLNERTFCAKTYKKVIVYYRKEKQIKTHGITSSTFCKKPYEKFEILKDRITEFHFKMDTNFKRNIKFCNKLKNKI